MTIRGRRCIVRLAQSAEDDYREIFRLTAEHFGHRQMRLYSSIIADTIDALRDGRRASGVKDRKDISPGLLTLHVAQSRREGRHILVFRIDERSDQPIVSVVRILHDSMDIMRHIQRAQEK